MIGIFGRAKQHPLTEFCTKLSAPENLLKGTNAMCAGDSSGIDKRAIVLTCVIMAAAGSFIGNLRWDRKKGMWEGSQRYLRNTNLDVITAEAIVWIYFLMRKFCENDTRRYPPPGQGTFPTARQIALSMIEHETGFDFNETVNTRWKCYQEAMKGGEDVPSIFASIVLHSVGRQSLAEPMKDLGPMPNPFTAEWTPLSLNVIQFFSTMPLAFYETFKNFLIALNDQEIEELARSAGPNSHAG